MIAKKKTTPKKAPKKPAASGKAPITKDMSFGEILQRFPQTFSVFSKYGMHCMGCSMSAYETVEQGAMAHGIDVRKFIADLNAAASAK